MMVYIIFFDWQFMSDIILHVFPFLNVLDSPVIMKLYMFRISARYILLLLLPLRVSMKISLLLKVFFNFAYDLWIVWVVCYYHW